MPFLLAFIRPSLVPSPAPSSASLFQACGFVHPSSKTQLYELNDGQEDLDRYDDAGTALDEKSRKDLFDVCRFFLFFAVYNVADGGLYSLFTSLAGSMTTNVGAGTLTSAFLNVRDSLSGSTE